MLENGKVQGPPPLAFGQGRGVRPPCKRIRIFAKKGQPLKRNASQQTTPLGRIRQYTYLHTRPRTSIRAAAVFECGARPDRGHRPSRHGPPRRVSGLPGRPVSHQAPIRVLKQPLCLPSHLPTHPSRSPPRVQVQGPSGNHAKMISRWLGQTVMDQASWNQQVWHRQWRCQKMFQ